MMSITPDTAVHIGMGSVTLALIGVFYSAMNRRLNNAENVIRGMGNSLDKKPDKDVCEGHRAHQTSINIDLIDRLARIETKIDLLKNGHSKDKNK